MRAAGFAVAGLSIVVMVLSGCTSVDYGSGSDAQGGRWSHEHDHDYEYDEEEEEASGEGITAEDCQEAFPDADPRFHQRIQGEEESIRVVSVPRNSGILQPNAVPLRVSAIFVLDGSAHITLKDPAGRIMSEEEFSGHKELEEASWFDTDAAMDGKWELRVRVYHGVGAYTFGAYVRG